MSVTQAEVLHHCPVLGQPEEAERGKGLAPFPRKTGNSSCLYLPLGFCWIKGFKDENGKRNAVGFRLASRTLKREKQVWKKQMCCVTAELNENAERFSWASSLIPLSCQPSISPYLHPYTADAARVSLEDQRVGLRKEEKKEVDSVYSKKTTTKEALVK